MASSNNKTTGLGILDRFPPEVRSQLFQDYSTNPITALKMVRSRENYPGTLKPRYDCFVQSSPWELRAVSKALNDEVPARRQPLELALNNLDSRKYSLLDRHWDLPTRIRTTATRVIIQVDPKETRELCDLDTEGSGDYESGRVLEMRIVLPDEEVEQWSNERKCGGAFEAAFNSGVHDATILRLLKAWVAKCSWAYTFSPNTGACAGDHVRGLPCSESCLNNAVVLDLECWRSSPREARKDGNNIKALVCWHLLRSSQAYLTLDFSSMLFTTS